MGGQFIGAAVEVRFQEKPGPPTSFLWEGREYHIAQVLEFRRTLDFHSAWWRRRHRDWYKVRTKDGRVFELYFSPWAGPALLGSSPRVID
ncbi:MAG: DUF6504 family protein [Candidatus Bipolaricaulaceae bacterium]